MKHLRVCPLAVVVTVLCLAIPGAAFGQSAVFFDDPTDVIQADGQTVIGTASTYEAIFLFPSDTGAGGIVFNEWTNFQEDKLLQVGKTLLIGYNFPGGSGFNVGAAIAPDVWHHVAFVYDGAEERMYLDGVLLASRAAGITVRNGAGLAHLGAIFRDGSIMQGFVGYLESVRISDVARYEGDTFTPPLEDFEPDANTQLLFNFDEPAGSPTVQDAGPLARTGTLGVGFQAATSPVLGATPPQASCPAVSTIDLWDVASGAVISGTSGFDSGSDAEGENIFGGSITTPEPGTAFFRDDQSDGYVHFVEWETQSAVAVRSIALLAAHDQNSQQRSFREYRLYAFDETANDFELFYEATPPLPYGGGNDSNILVECANVSEVTASRFRAEFVQNGNFTFSGPRLIELDAFSTTIGLAVSMEELPTHAGGATLHPNYPNPFTGATTVAFTLERPQWVNVKVYDVLGREVAGIADGYRSAGLQEVRFVGAGLPSGVYFVRLETEDGPAQTRRLTLLR